MHGVGLDRDVREWFAGARGRLARPSVDAALVRRALAER
jgi:hypothetical protein